VALAVVGLVVGERVVLTSESIRKTGPFMRQQKMAWADVASITFQKDGDMALLSIQGSRITVSPYLAGVVDMLDSLERYLPQAVLQDCGIDLARYRAAVALRPRTAPRASRNQSMDPSGNGGRALR
jgi:hypothetical protein